MNSKIVDVAYLIILAVAAAIIIRTLHLIYDLTRPMPYWDCWEFMKSIPAILDGQYTLHDLFAFHNEHRIVTTRLVMLADIALFAGTGIYLRPCSRRFSALWVVCCHFLLQNVPGGLDALQP